MKGVVLAGGTGSRLFPLTQQRSKPAGDVAENLGAASKAAGDDLAGGEAPTPKDSTAPDPSTSGDCWNGGS